MGNASGSEKKDKRRNNRVLRKKVRDIIKKHGMDENTDLDDVLLPEMKDVSNVGSMQKDGKQYFGNIDDVEYKDKLMRK